MNSRKKHVPTLKSVLHPTTMKYRAPPSIDYIFSRLMAEVMRVDWPDESFPKHVPGDYELDKLDDTMGVQRFLKNKKNFLNSSTS